MRTPDHSVDISVTINGTTLERRVLPRLSLADFLRYTAGLTGTHLGCEHGICGACTVRMNGAIIRSCLTLAVQADGAAVDTIEGISASGEIDDLKAAFHVNNAAQCGFCTPAMLITAAELLACDHQPDRRTIRDFLSGNYCRCTGYQAIVDAVEQVAMERADGG
jgi:aerobic carbon-monoxide dehydrogenase small subunit